MRSPHQSNAGDRVEKDREKEREGGREGVRENFFKEERVTQQSRTTTGIFFKGSGDSIDIPTYYSLFLFA